MPRIHWQNWAGNQECECEIEHPRSLEHLQDVVKRAGKRGRVRALGGGYSWSPLVPTDGTLVAMDRLTEIAVDRAARTVEVQCGATIEQLTEATKKEGLTLITPTLFPRPTVGGAIAIGCHGTGFGSGNFSDQIIEMTIVKADGSTEVVDERHPHFEAAKVSLGSLGIVYSVKLEVEKEFNVYTDKRQVPVDYVLEEFPDLLKSYEFVEIFWFPLQSHMWLYLMDRTESWADKQTLVSGARRDLDTWIENTGGTLISWVAKNAPRLTPYLNRVASNLANEVEQVVEKASDAFHFQRAYPKNWDCSYAVPVEHTRSVWSEGIELVNEYARADLYPVNLALHCRFTGGSKTWLSPDHGRETCYIEVATAKGTPTRLWDPFFREMEARWFAIPGARPHWGKIYDQWDKIAGRYPMMGEFKKVREHWDPRRVFQNPFLEKAIFQLPPRP